MERKIAVKARVYARWAVKNGTGHYANVDINGIMHISNITVMESDDGSKINVFPPSSQNKGNFYKHVEFPYREQNPLYEAIREACISALEKYKLTSDPKQYGDTFEIEVDDIFFNAPSQTSNDVPFSDLPF